MDDAPLKRRIDYDLANLFTRKSFQETWDFQDIESGILLKKFTKEETLVFCNQIDDVISSRYNALCQTNAAINNLFNESELADFNYKELLDNAKAASILKYDVLV